MKTTHYLIWTEAEAMLPLVRRILSDVRETRASISKLRRRSQRFDLGRSERRMVRDRLDAQLDRLEDLLREATRCGFEITPGIRCEAWFPFEHQWIGPGADHKIREAYFVYNDAQATIAEWFFAGWPTDRRKVPAKWKVQYRSARPAVARTRRKGDVPIH